MSVIPFCGPSYQGRSLSANASRCINFYPESTGVQDDKTQLMLVGCPGTLVFAVTDAATNPIRGLYSFGGKLFSVSTNHLNEIASDGTVTVRGTLTTSSGRVSFADNGLTSGGVGGNQMMLVDGTNGYTFDPTTNTFTQITDPDFLSNPTQVAYCDGYFVVINASMQVRASDLYNGLSWSGLATAAVNSLPDNVKAVVAFANQLFFIKEYTSETWYDTGNPTSSGFPFSRVSGAVYDYGTSAPWSVARGGNSIFFVTTTRTNANGAYLGVAQITNYQPTIISPPPVAYRISQSTDISQCFGYCYADQGHMFYVLTNPVDNWTFVYDVSTQMWHERSSFDNGVTFNRHLSNCYVYHGGKHYVGDYRNAFVSEMSRSYYNDTGVPINCVRTTPHIYDNNELKKVFVSRLDVDMEPGVGLTPGVQLLAFKANGAIKADGSVTAGGVLSGATDPQAYLSWSNDGGHTYGSEYAAAIGQQGQYGVRCVWRRLGYSRARVWRLRISDPVTRNVLGAYARIGL